MTTCWKGLEDVRGFTMVVTGKAVDVVPMYLGCSVPLGVWLEISSWEPDLCRAPYLIVDECNSSTGYWVHRTWPDPGPCAGLCMNMGPSGIPCLAFPGHTGQHWSPWCSWRW